jgi:hypothetical protein
MAYPDLPLPACIIIILNLRASARALAARRRRAVAGRSFACVVPFAVLCVCCIVRFGRREGRIYWLEAFRGRLDSVDLVECRLV